MTSSNQLIKIGLLGFGNVGKSVFQGLNENRKVIRPKIHCDYEITKVVVRDVKKDRGIDSSLLTDDPIALAKDPEIDVIVELMGDCPEALEAMKVALQNGKSVVTANKAIVATHGKELFEIADQNGAKLLFEASVGGGIPVLRSLREGISGNKILTLRGIINGTANYILTEMEEKNADFGDVLKKAQELGYAEADPTSDIEGHDSAYKLSILAMLSYGCHIPVEKIFCQGISSISAIDIDMAKQFWHGLFFLVF